MNTALALPSATLPATGHPEHSVRARQKAFLTALEQLGTIKAAAKMIGIEEHTASRWCKKSPAFRLLVDTAKDHARKYVILDKIEENFYQRAIAGKEDGSSAIIGMFVAKRCDPQYKDTAQVNVVSHGPVAIQLNFGASPHLTKAETQADSE